MLSIYRYTLNKYLKSWSTWVICVISCLIVFILGGLVPFKLGKTLNNSEYAITIISLVSSITSFMCIFSSVFSGFKAATMFKDEVEDGTFLVILSKPVHRSKIIFGKWLSLQTISLSYTLLVALTFLFAVLALDNGSKVSHLDSLGIKTLKSQMGIVMPIMWGIFFVVSLIFSSITLLLSTRLSVGTSIGIATALGVIIPITGLISVFTSKTPFTQLSKADTLSWINDEEKEEGLNIKSTAPTNTLYNLGMETGDSDSFDVAKYFDLNYHMQRLSDFASEEAVSTEARNKIENKKKVTLMKVVENNDSAFAHEKMKEQQIILFNKAIVDSWLFTNDIRQALFKHVKDYFLNTPFTVTKTKMGAIDLHYDALNTLMKSKGLQGTYSNLNEVNKVEIFDFLSTFVDMNETSLANVNSEEFGVVWHAIKVICEKYKSNWYEGFATKDATTIKNVTKLSYLSSPIGFWIDGGKINQAKSASGFQMKEIDKTNDLKSLSFLSSLVIANDKSEYETILSGIKSTYFLAKIDSINYSNKLTILWVYLGIALVLIPLSYVSIARKDFR